MVVRNEHLEDGGWAGVVVLRLGWARLGKARQGKTGQSEQDYEGGQSQNGPTQASSPWVWRGFHFNSDGWKLQEDCVGGNQGLKLELGLVGVRGNPAWL